MSAAAAEKITYQIEIYNLFERINPDSRRERFAGNGWYVSQLVNGRRGRQWDFKGDEEKARAFLADKKREATATN